MCALELERRALAHGGLKRRFELRCCGPGERLAAHLDEADAPPADSIVILAGISGGLDPNLRSGAVVVASRIVDFDSGESFVPTLQVSAPGAVHASIASSRSVLATVEQKRAARVATTADAVDLESASFARLAMQRRWRWTVVRGISDAANEPLPAEVMRWIDSRGKTRPARLLLDAVRRPSLLRELPRLRRGSRAAMRAVVEMFHRTRIDGSET